MRALLVLFMVDKIKNGGMSLDDEMATAIYGLYTAFVHLACLPGGWMADRLLGARKAVWVGSLVIAAGHLTLAIPNQTAFLSGLILVVLGTGLLKPNVSAMVGQLYPEGGARRDAGFTLFHMGINMGAFLGPLVCSYLGENVNWYMGFAAAGVGMIFGVIQFWRTGHRLGDAGLIVKGSADSNTSGSRFDRAWFPVVGFLAMLVLLIVLIVSGALQVNALSLAQYTAYVIVGLAVAFFVYLFVFGKLNPAEFKQTLVIVVLFISSAVFWF
jgi:POT family proton-dependent oligopeptide transporter